MKNTVILVLLLASFASCTQQELPKIVEGEILKVTTEIHQLKSENQTIITWVAEIDTTQNGERKSTCSVPVTWSVANDFTKCGQAGYQPYFIRMSLNNEYEYDGVEIAYMNYDVMGTPPWYQFQSDKKLIGN